MELIRLQSAQGKLIHACIRIGDSAFMLADESPDWDKFGPKSLKGSPVTSHLCVVDVDAFVAPAASIKAPPEEIFP